MEHEHAQTHPCNLQLQELKTKAMQNIIPAASNKKRTSPMPIIFESGLLNSICLSRILTHLIFVRMFAEIQSEQQSPITVFTIEQRTKYFEQNTPHHGMMFSNCQVVLHQGTGNVYLPSTVNIPLGLTENKQKEAQPADQIHNDKEQEAQKD